MYNMLVHQYLLSIASNGFGSIFASRLAFPAGLCKSLSSTACHEGKFSIRSNVYNAIFFRTVLEVIY